MFYVVVVVEVELLGERERERERLQAGLSKPLGRQDFEGVSRGQLFICSGGVAKRDWGTEDRNDA